jgi:Peptidase C13 family/YcxB-like protein
MEQPFETREFTLSQAEYRLLLRRMLLQRRGRPLLMTWLLVAFWLLSSLSKTTAFSAWMAVASWSPLLLLLTAATLWLTLGQPWRIATHRNNRWVYQPRRVRFSDDGITQELADGSRGTRPWQAYVRAEEVAGLVVLLDDAGHYLAIPRLAFPDPESAQALIRRVAPPGPQEAQGPAPAMGLWRGLKANLGAGLRLALWRRPTLASFQVSADQALLLLPVSVAALGLGDYLAVDGSPEFSTYGLMYHGLCILLLLIGVYLAARTLRRPERTLALAVVLLSAAPLLQLVSGLVPGLGLEDSGALAWLIPAALLLWLLRVWWNGLELVLQRGQQAIAVATVVLFAVAVAPQTQLPASHYWEPGYTGGPLQERETVNAEDIYYAQPELLQRSLAAVSPGRPGVVDLYHIGFGSYSPQKVFRREINHVRGILDDRFDTRGRSLVLINDPQSAQEVPIASITNLKLALKGIAGRMSTDEDVLLLYLTSHGSRDAELSVRFPPLHLNQLTAGTLRRMLDEAGIRWRVLVISACYSGSFVDTLKNDDTLLITAASKARTSFGCSNENEYTYFGEAYFKQGLEQTHSFVDAFQVAKHWIEQREHSEGKQPSHPTLYVGSAIEAKLRELQRRLAAG